MTEANFTGGMAVGVTVKKPDANPNPIEKALNRAKARSEARHPAASGQVVSDRVTRALALFQSRERTGIVGFFPRGGWIGFVWAEFRGNANRFSHWRQPAASLLRKFEISIRNIHKRNLLCKKESDL